MMMIMRSSITSSPFLLRSLLNPKSLCSHPQFLNRPQFPENPNTEKITSAFESESGSENADFTQPISQNSVFTQAHLINTLLTHKNNPRSALNHFKQVERNRGFVKTVDAFCVLLHILVGFPETQKLAKTLLTDCVFGDSAPAPDVFVDHLVECANRFGFVLDSRVFNYLLNSYVRANRIEDAVLCYNRMIESDIIPWVPYVNILLAALVRRNMFGEIHELHNKMVCRGISGDCYTVHVMMRACLKDGKPEKAEEYFREAKAKGIELDAEVYSIVIQAVCKKPNLSLAFVLLKEMKEMGWVPSEGTYTCVIGTCVKHGNMVEVLRLKDEMVSCGKSMNLVVATNLMKGYCLQGNLDGALILFNRMDFHRTRLLTQF